ncbi:MAG: recombinase family protein [Lachnospirales bacterium]
MAVEKKVKVIRPLSELQETIPRLKVCAYCRVSTELEGQDNSYETQKRYYEELIKKNSEWEFVKVYADKGSGKSTENRPSFIEMLDDCDYGKIDLIITKSISRFARNTLDTVKFVRELKEKDIYIKFEKENINTEKIDNEFLFNLMASFAQLERESLVANIRVGNQNKFKQGTKKLAKAPYGYSKDINGDIVINEAEAENVRLIYNLYIEGNTGNQIAEYLNEKGIKSSKGKDWCSLKITTNIIKNEFYIGTRIFQKYVKTEKQKSYTENKGELPKYVVENHHEAIITKEDFIKANEILTERRNQYGAGKRSSYTIDVFSNKLSCEICGKNLLRNNNRYNKTYFVCKSCSDVKVSKDFLQKIFLTARRDFIKNYKSFKEENIINNVDFEELRRLESKLEKIEQQKNILNRLKQDNVIDIAVYIEKNNKLETDIKSIKLDITNCKNHNRSRVNKNFDKYFSELPKEQEFFDDNEFKGIIDNVLVKNDKVTFISKTEQRFEYRNFYQVSNFNILYGYRKINGKHIINQYEKDIINFMFDEFLQGANFKEIKIKLEEKGYLTNTGKSKWDVTQIRYYLTNTKYLGNDVYSQIVDTEKFNSVQDLYSKKHRKGVVKDGN